MRISSVGRASASSRHPGGGRGLRIAAWSVAASLLPLAACGDGETNTQVLARVEADQGARAADEGRVQCALAGAAAFARVCEIERTETDRGLVLTIRHPDGGFRRLLVTKDGRGVVAADGAEPAIVTIVDPREIEVALAGDHYRLPATVGRAKR